MTSLAPWLGLVISAFTALILIYKWNKEREEVKFLERNKADNADVDRIGKSLDVLGEALERARADLKYYVEENERLKLEVDTERKRRIASEEYFMERLRKAEDELLRLHNELRQLRKDYPNGQGQPEA